jgi:hypothetical protein
MFRRRCLSRGAFVPALLLLFVAGCTFEVAGPASRPFPEPAPPPVPTRTPPPSRAPAPAPAPDHHPSPNHTEHPGNHPKQARKPKKGPPVRAGKYAHLPQRQSFCPKTSVDLKEGCYEGDFVLGSSQIKVCGAGVGKTVIHGNLVLQTQCTVSNLTVTGDVIFEGHQAELKDADFFGRIIDNGMQNRY